MGDTMNVENYLQVTRENLLNAPEGSKYMCIQEARYYKYLFGQVLVYSDGEWVVYDGPPIGMTRSIIDMEYAIGMHSTETHDVLDFISKCDGVTITNIVASLDGQIDTVTKQVNELVSRDMILISNDIPPRYVLN
jgi:hypothetical protein